jgi:hypothetical protein
MFARCPHCSKQAVPFWKKPFVNNEYIRYIKCHSCGELLVLSYKWISIYVLLSLLIIAIVAFSTIRFQKPDVFTKFIITYCFITIPVFIIAVPFKPYKP